MRSVTSPNSWRPGIGLKYPTFLGFTAHVPIPSMIGTAIQLLATSSIIRFVAAVRLASSLSATIASYALSASTQRAGQLWGSPKRC